MGGFFFFFVVFGKTDFRLGSAYLNSRIASSAPIVLCWALYMAAQKAYGACFECVVANRSDLRAVRTCVNRRLKFAGK